MFAGQLVRPFPHTLATLQMGLHIRELLCVRLICNNSAFFCIILIDKVVIVAASRLPVLFIGPRGTWGCCTKIGKTEVPKNCYV